MSDESRFVDVTSGGEPKVQHCWVDGAGWETEPFEPDIVDVRPPDRRELRREFWKGVLYSTIGWAIGCLLADLIRGGQ